MNNNNEERFEKISKLRVIYPDIVQISKDLNKCHVKAKRRPEPPCLLITGMQGVGKTTLYKTYAENYPRMETDEGTIIPCLTAVIPVPATVKGLVTSLLESAGDPDPTAGDIVRQTIRLRRILDECRTEIIFLDEFQHIIDRDSERVLKTTADWLKNLVNQTKIPVVLLGMPSSVRILEANPQLRRRFTIRSQMMPFAWSQTINGKTIYPMRNLLAVIERMIPLKYASNLSDENLAYRIYCASGGVIDSIMKLVRGAADLAIEDGTEQITLNSLAAVYDDELAANQPNIPHPFIVTTNLLKPFVP